jgi:hypothetical protein
MSLLSSFSPISIYLSSTPPQLLIHPFFFLLLFSISVSSTPPSPSLSPRNLDVGDGGWGCGDGEREKEEVKYACSLGIMKERVEVRRLTWKRGGGRRRDGCVVVEEVMRDAWR